MAAAMIGAHLTKNDHVIPDYATWTRRQLTGYVRDLEDDFADAVKKILLKPQRSKMDSFAVWLSNAFDEFQKTHRPFSLCTAQEFESLWGPLRFRERIEVPPYAEMLLQGWHGLALRHPEYMLARDLAFLVSLFRDSEQLLTKVNWANPPRWAGYGSENSQALARAVIQTCFNLLESFVSGLARAHVMTSTTTEES